MKAMILAAGVGSRMGSITETLPKALVPVAGVPIIARVIERLKAVGVTGVCVNLHHFGDKIKEFFNSQQNFGLEVFFSEEQELLDTGGGLAYAKDYFQGEQVIFLHNADVYTDIDLMDLYNQQLVASNNTLASLLVRRKSSGRIILFDQRGLAGWRNTETGAEGLARNSANLEVYGFCGVQALSTGLFKFFPKDTEKFSLMTVYMNAVRANCVIQPYELGACHWFDMGSPERLDLLEKHLSVM